MFFMGNDIKYCNHCYKKTKSIKRYRCANCLNVKSAWFGNRRTRNGHDRVPTATTREERFWDVV